MESEVLAVLKISGKDIVVGRIVLTSLVVVDRFVLGGDYETTTVLVLANRLASSL